MKAEKTSIIIVTYNAPDYVRQCLESVVRHTSAEHEILVVDNASDRPTRDFLVGFAESHPVRLVLNGENRLWSPGNNDGLRIAAADSRFCLLLNSDTEVLRGDWLARLQEPMHRFHRISITGTVHNFVPMGPMYGAIDGCCFMARKSLFDELGLLDENYPWNGAGFIFCAKAWSRGHYYYRVGEPEIVHHYGKRSRIDSQTRLRNQDVDLKGIQRGFGLRPRWDVLSYLRHRLGRFDPNARPLELAGAPHPGA